MPESFAGNLINVDEVLGKFTILTRGRSKIVIDDVGRSLTLQDVNGNIIEMNADGIKITSIKDVTITAAGAVNITATGNISSTAQADIRNQALNINNTANSGFTAKGSVSAELSASGTTTVKGAMVMIN